jgi:hypothetical protein
VAITIKALSVGTRTAISCIRRLFAQAAVDACVRLGNINKRVKKTAEATPNASVKPRRPAGNLVMPRSGCEVRCESKLIVAARGGLGSQFNGTSTASPGSRTACFSLPRERT